MFKWMAEFTLKQGEKPKFKNISSIISTDRLITMISNTSRVSRIVTKRRISISISPSMDTSSRISDSSKSSTEASRASNRVSVAHFLQVAQRSYTSRQNTSITPQKMNLSSTQSSLGSQLRSLIQSNDGKELHHEISSMYSTGDWNAVLQGLTRPEISLLLNTLIQEHERELVFGNNVKNLVSLDKKKLQFHNADVMSKNIDHLYHRLISADGIKLSISDLELLLRFASKNLHYSQAVKLVSYCDSLGIKTLNYENLKMEILAQTSPHYWESQNSQTLTFRHSTSSPNQSFSKLLYDFAQKAHQFTPNLESHKHIISGLAHSQELPQVRAHISQVWGIPMDDSPPTELVSVTSSLYPDVDLLHRLVQTFGYNGCTMEGLEYVLKFVHYYDMDIRRSSEVWRTIISMIQRECKSDNERLAILFQEVWNIMKEQKVVISDAIFQKRCDIFSLVSKEFDLINDLSSLRDNCLNQSTKMNKHRFEKVLTSCLKSIALSIYRNAQDFDEAERVIHAYFEQYAVSEMQLEALNECLPELKEIVERQRNKFEELQRQYDEEDDEGSLW